MSRIGAKCLAVLLLVVGCGWFAVLHAKQGAATVVYKNGPMGVGNPPAAGKLVVDIEWANCTGAYVVVTAVWDVPAGKNPIQTSTAMIVGTTTGSLKNQQFAPLPSGKSVQFVTEVRDKNATALAQTQSNAVTVP